MPLTILAAIPLVFCLWWNFKDILGGGDHYATNDDVGAGSSLTAGAKTGIMLQLPKPPESF